MMKPQNVERMCIVCRQVQPVYGLLRFVLDPRGYVVLDYRERLQGRGAYVCLHASCLQKACQKSGAFSRAFKTSVQVDTRVLMADMEDVLKRAIASNLGLAFVAKQCVAGRDQVALAAQKTPIKHMLLATDLSERSVSEVEVETPSLRDVPVVRLFSKSVIGDALGRGETGVVGLFKGHITDRIICDVKRYLSIVEIAKEGV